MDKSLLVIINKSLTAVLLNWFCAPTASESARLCPRSADFHRYRLSLGDYLADLSGPSGSSDDGQTFGCARPDRHSPRKSRKYLRFRGIQVDGAGKPSTEKQGMAFAEAPFRPPVRHRQEVP